MGICTHGHVRAWSPPRADEATADSHESANAYHPRMPHPARSTSTLPPSNPTWFLGCLPTSYWNSRTPRDRRAGCQTSWPTDTFLATSSAYANTLTQTTTKLKKNPHSWIFLDFLDFSLILLMYFIIARELNMSVRAHARCACCDRLLNYIMNVNMNAYAYIYIYMN